MILLRRATTLFLSGMPMVWLRAIKLGLGTIGLPRDGKRGRGSGEQEVFTRAWSHLCTIPRGAERHFLELRFLRIFHRGTSMNNGKSMHEDAVVGRILQYSYPGVGSADPVSYVSELGDSVQALVYSRLFWPKLVEVEGAVFVALWGDDEEYIAERLRTPASSTSMAPMSWAKVVDSFNLFEVAHIFRQNRGSTEVVESANRELGLILVQAWSARLEVSYPQRRFSVRFVEADETMDSRVEVSQEHPLLVAPQGWSDKRRAILPGAPPGVDGSS
jgi:hypothetical protein